MNDYGPPLRPGEQVTYYSLLMLYDYIRNNIHELCSSYFCGCSVFVFELKNVLYMTQVCDVCF